MVSRRRSAAAAAERRGERPEGLDRGLKASIAVGEEGRQPGQEAGRYSRVGKSELTQPVAVSPGRPGGLRRQREDRGVVGEEGRPGGEREQAPVEPPSALERRQQRDCRQDHAQRRDRVRARLGRVEDREGAQREDGRTHQRRGPSDAAQPERVDRRDGRHARDEGRHPQPYVRIAQLARGPGHHVVERRRDLQVARHSGHDVVNPAPG
jgi:hypothetical protein